MKHFSLKRIRDVFPKFNVEPVLEDEFWLACKRFKIIVKSLPLTVDGYHEKKRGRNYILINSELTGIKWLHTALHELCHFLFDAPSVSKNHVFFRYGYSERAEQRDPREEFADAFALACILPLPELKRLANEDLSDNPEVLQLCGDRIAAMAEFKF